MLLQSPQIQVAAPALGGNDLFTSVLGSKSLALIILGRSLHAHCAYTDRQAHIHIHIKFFLTSNSLSWNIQTHKLFQLQFFLQNDFKKHKGEVKPYHQKFLHPFVQAHIYTNTVYTFFFVLPKFPILHVSPTSIPK